MQAAFHFSHRFSKIIHALYFNILDIPCNPLDRYSLATSETISWAFSLPDSLSNLLACLTMP